MNAQRLSPSASATPLALGGIALAAAIAAALAVGGIAGAGVTTALDAWSRAAAVAPVVGQSTGRFDAVSFRAGERSLDWAPTFDAVRFRAQERSLDANS